MQSAGEDVFGGFGETDVGHAHASPGAGDGKENFGEVQDEGLLLFEGKHEIAVALFRGGESGEDAAVDAEIGLAHVGRFFGAGEGEGGAAKVSDVHGRYATAGWREWGIGIWE